MSAFAAQAQCNELFISEYFEGSYNNRGLEIYNPTNQAIDLSGYSVVRFSNGATTAGADYTVTLSSYMLQPHATYVIATDKRDPNGTSFEAPLFNGTEVIDTVTGGIQLDANQAYVRDANVYDATRDLEGRVDEFVCPVYNDNSTLYHNGNDAMALISGTTVATDGSNLLDVVGVIGADPGSDGWTTAGGDYLTKDRDLVRKASVTEGVLLIDALGDTFNEGDWEVNPKNTFVNLGNHTCDCNTSTSTSDVNATNLRIFPNPTANNRVNVVSQTPIATVSVLNTLGQLVGTYNYSNTTTAVVTLDGLTNGLFVLSIQLENGETTTQKILVK